MQTEPRIAGGEVAVLAGTLIPGTGRDPVEGVVILIRDGRIERIGPQETTRVDPSRRTVIDASTRVVLPGLIDAHCHLFHIGRHYSAPVVSFIARGIANAGLWLDTGVTTVRDVSTRDNLDLGLRAAIAAGLVRGPRMFCSGSGLASTGGGPLGEEPLRFIIEVTGVEAARRAARQQLRAGVDFVKLFATAGLTEGARPQMTVEEMAAAVAEAHKAGKHAAGHGFFNEGIKNALHAGVDTIEHGSYLDEEAVDLMRARDVVLVPTLSILHTMVEHGATWGRPAVVIDNARLARDAATRSVRLAREAGLRIAAGTDPPYHDTVAMECAALVAAGLTPMEAIVAATRRGAEILGRSGDFGTLQVGRRADLIVLAADPLRDIRALARVDLVMQDGVVVGPLSPSPAGGH